MNIALDPVTANTSIEDNRTGLLPQIGGRDNQTTIRSGMNKAGLVLTLGSDAATDVNAYADKKRSAADVAVSADAAAVQTQRDMMVVMSATMSIEDFQKALDEGFDLKEINSKPAVTILDKIKVEVAKGGTEVKGFTDTVDKETLKEITGSEAAANAMEQAFSENDLPLTKDSAAQVKEALDMAAQISAPDDGTIRYLTENEMTPDLQNLYMAEHSTNGLNHAGKGFYAQETTGYYAKRAEDTDVEALAPQVKKLLEDAGFNAADDAVLDEAMRMIEEGLPLTKASLERVMTLKQMHFPLTKEDTIRAAAAAIADGQDALHAVPGQEETLKAKIGALDEESLKQLKTLEETRLIMTLSATKTMADAGLTIDTEQMEAAIDAMDAAIRALQDHPETGFEEAQAFVSDPAVSATVEVFRERQAIYSQTMTQITAVQEAPAAIIGELSETLMADTLDEIADKSHAAKQRYAKAGETYEALMTKPRTDLGDSIKKAFRNTDDLLNDLGEETSEQNRRAIRILGYNRMEVTAENLDKVRTLDAKLTGVMDRLCPAAVLEMIREGKNPLSMTLEELDDFLASQETQDAATDEKYAKFLYKLEKNDAITAEERTSYIGIYRLFHTLKKTDDAAIGALLNTGAEMTVRNLLTATRTNAKAQRGIDVRADERFAGVDGVQKGTSISTQIDAAFLFYKAQADTVYEKIEPEKLHVAGANEDMPLTELATQMKEQPLDEALEAAWREETLHNMRTQMKEAASDEALLKEVTENGYETGLNALEAMRAIRAGRRGGTSAWKEMEDLEEVFTGGKEITERTRSLLNDLTEADDAAAEYAEALSGMSEALEDLLTAQNAAEPKYVDVKQIALLHKQLSVASRAASEQGSFEIPVETEDGTVSMHVTLRQTADAGSRMTASLQTQSHGRISLQMSVTEDGANAAFSTDFGETPEQSAFMEGLKVRFVNGWNAAGQALSIAAEQIPVLYHAAEPPAFEGEASTVSGKTLFVAAEQFVNAVVQG